MVLKVVRINHDNLKDILKELRKELNISQEILAEKLEYARLTIMKYENGSRCANLNNLIDKLNQSFGEERKTFYIKEID